MSRSSLFKYTALWIVLAAGCDSAAQQQQHKAVTAQNEANDKIVAATKEADDKVVKAQVDANKKIADAQASFLKLREDYRHDVTTGLVDFDRKVVELEGKASQAKGKAKAELDAKLTQIRASRAAFATDYKNLETESAASWDATKARLDKEWKDLKAMAD